MKRVFKMKKGPKDRVIFITTLSCNINNHISMLTHILVGTKFTTLVLYLTQINDWKERKSPKDKRRLGPIKRTKERERESNEGGGPVLNGPGWKWADIGPEFGKMSPNSATQKKRHRGPDFLLSTLQSVRFRSLGRKFCAGLRPQDSSFLNLTLFVYYEF